MPVDIMDGIVKEYRAGNAMEFWHFLSPENPPLPGNAILYRGQGDSTWKLEPSLFRNDKGNNDRARLVSGGGAITAQSQVVSEWMALADFVKHCDRVGLTIPCDSNSFREKYFSTCPPDEITMNPEQWPPDEVIELMALAQHHGLPTRLLDWTRRSWVAACFAASSALANGTSQPLAVWALNLALQGLFPELKVVNVPGSNNANVAAQAGAFTLLRQSATARRLSFSGPTALDEYLKGKTPCPLIKVTVASSEASAVLDLAEKYHITRGTIYPDYYGAAMATIDSLNRWRHKSGA